MSAVLSFFHFSFYKIDSGKRKEADSNADRIAHCMSSPMTLAMVNKATARSQLQRQSDHNRSGSAN
jgi:hypothetical protein